MDIRIFPPEEMIETDITLPLSKSMSNRALIMNALTPASEPLERVAKCEDTDVMLAAIASEPKGEINIKAAGTAMRFLTAYFASLPGAEVTLDGTERMRKRPIGPLVEALRGCGAEIDYLGEDGYPPLKIRGQRLNGGAIDIDATISSQYISAIMMVAPTFASELTICLHGEVASWPYLNMTMQMMRRRGINVERDGDRITIAPGTYLRISASDIERDWSAASYWYSIAALSAGWITLNGLQLPSLQGDSRITGIFEKIGVLTAQEDGNIELSASPEVYSRLDEDLSDCPDVVQTLVVACCMIGVPFRFTGVKSLRIKETDRIEALRRECLKIACEIEVLGDDTIRWEGRRMPMTQLPEIDTYNDHRMAMAFAPAAMYIPGIVLRDCEVVAKSYPTFWEDLSHAGFVMVDASLPLEGQQS